MQNATYYGKHIQHMLRHELDGLLSVVWHIPRHMLNFYGAPFNVFVL